MSPARGCPKITPSSERACSSGASSNENTRKLCLASTRQKKGFGVLPTGRRARAATPPAPFRFPLAAACVPSLRCRSSARNKPACFSKNPRHEKQTLRLHIPLRPLMVAPSTTSGLVSSCTSGTIPGNLSKTLTPCPAAALSRTRSPARAHARAHTHALRPHHRPHPASPPSLYFRPASALLPRDGGQTLYRLAHNLRFTCSQLTPSAPKNTYISPLSPEKLRCISVALPLFPLSSPLLPFPSN